jgi:cytochrome P450
MCSVFERLFDRVTTMDITINGVVFKKGTIVNTFIKSVFYNPDYFPEPFTFNPERWKDPENT